jgi:hypothetical protein
MQHAELTCLMRDGSLATVANTSLEPILEVARKARDTGLLDGNPVHAGQVLCSWALNPCLEFHCSPSPAESVRRVRKGSLLRG